MRKKNRHSINGSGIYQQKKAAARKPKDGLNLPTLDPIERALEFPGGHLQCSLL